MNSQDSKTMELAIGRILRLASRPEQAGDVAEYERCHAIIMDLAGPQIPGYTPNYVRDRNLGAQGDAR